MHPRISRARSASAMALLGTASFLTIAGTAAAEAQGNQPIEEVLVTGSLIRGAPAVGVAVTALSDQDFKETGALTVSDMLKAVPSLNVTDANAVTNNGGLIQKAQTVTIHGLTSASGTETLLMINGMRFPVQGFGVCYVDPSIIPQLAVDHIDVLADGASATYGSDAIAGVINVIMKHGFEGAVSQVRYARSTDIGDSNFQASQLYGTKWNTGSVTVSYQWYHEDNVFGVKRPYFTLDFEPYGFDNKSPVAVSMPGIVSTGSLQTDSQLKNLLFSAAAGSRACVNCYSIPAGTGWNYGDTPAHTNPTAPGSVPTVSWTTLLANQGVKNLRNPAADADILPSEDHNSATLTFDQDLIYDVKFFGEAFYSNRRAIFHYLPGSSPSAEQALRAQAVPTTNPYYPSGAPAGLAISYDLGVEHNSRINSGEIAERYDFGFTDDNLPLNWHGRLYYTMNYDGSFVHVTGMVNLAMVSAALGNTVPSVAANGSTPGQAAFVKPANIPYLNLFCDATKFTCNSQITEDYIAAYRDYDVHWQQNEAGINLDGPVTDLPGGTVRAALGANTVSYHYFRIEHSNFKPPNTSVVAVVPDISARATWAVFGQLNVPVIGEMNKIPLVEALNVEVAYRYDRYYDLGGVTTPKLAATWNVAYGLSLRGTWGKSFREPFPAETSVTAGAVIEPYNLAAGANGTNISLTCPAVPGLSTGTTPNAGSLNAYLNPSCAAATATPGGVHVGGGSGVAAPLRAGPPVTPEKGKNWALGANFQPMGFLAGLDLDVSWYHIRFDNVILNNTGGVNINDPLAKACVAPGPGCVYLVRVNPSLPITDPTNAVFLAMVNAELSNPRSTVLPSHLTDIQFIFDNASTNLGWREVSGLDFDARYDFDLGDWGAWNAGVTGNYKLQDKTQSFPGSAVVNVLKGNVGGVLKYRGRLGWTGSEGLSQGLSVTGFVNFYPHGAVTATTIPPCYWSTGINPVTGVAFKAGDCYPGSPFWGPYSVFPNLYPGVYTFDLSIGYQTGARPTNEYLRNLNIQFTVNDLLNKAPPFNYEAGSAAGRGLAVASIISPQQQYISFSVTKTW